MCLLLSQNLTTDKPLTRDLFNTIFSQNPHGSGVGYYLNGKPVILVNMHNSGAWDNYQKAVTDLTSDKNLDSKRLMLHFRWATHGSKTVNNVHPFYIEADGGAILGHNGVTSHYGFVAPDDWSDTRCLAQGVIEQHLQTWLTPESRKVIDRNLGSSRCVIFNATEYWDSNFPKQDEPEVAEYGRFSNFNFITRFSRAASYGASSGFGAVSGGLTTVSQFPSKETEGIKILAYCLIRNFTVAEMMTFLHLRFKGFPFAATFAEMFEQFEAVLHIMAEYNMDDTPYHSNKEISDMKEKITDDELLNAWLQYNDLESPDPHLEANTKIISPFETAKRKETAF